MTKTMKTTALKSHKRLALMLAAGASTLPLMLAAPVHAQEADTDTNARQDADDVIIVSARRREESLQDTPVAVTAVSEDQLVQAGAVDITSVQKLTPNATIEVARGSNSTLIAFIRGVGQQDPLWGFEPGVGLYVDDVYIARPQGAVLDIFDIERIEVLRGPQGTLYGRNTIGGAIKYVTKDLNMDAPEFRAKVNVGSYGQFDQILSGSVPLGDTFAIGAAIANYDRDGYGENVFTGAEHYNKDLIAGRLSAEWRPDDDLFFRLAGDWTQDDSNAKHGHRLLPGVTNGEPVLDDIYDTRGGAGDQNSVETEGYSFLGEWDMNDVFTFKSITAYREDYTETPIDFDALPTNDFDVPAYYDNSQLTQEFQTLFESGAISGVAGLYYLNGTYEGAFDTVLGNLGVNAPTFGKVSKTSVSGFADITWDINDLWSVSAGGRYTEDNTKASVIRHTYLGAAPSPFLGGTPRAPFAETSNFTSERTDDRFSPRVSVSYEPMQELSLYASYSEGFKSGGFDPRGNAGPEFVDADNDGNADDRSVTYDVITQGFAPEIVDSFEVGAKGSLADGKILYQAAAFYSQYTDQQITVQTSEPDPVTGINTFVSTVLNAGESEYAGLELESQIFFNDIFSADVTLGYIDAEIKEIITIVADPNTGDPVEADISDNYVVQNTPDFTGRLALNADLPIPSQYGTLRLTAAASYRSDYNIFNVDNEGAQTDPLLPAGTPSLDPDAYTLLDLTALWDVNENWRVSVAGRNLTNEEYKVAGYNFAGSAQLGVDGAYSAFYGAPRTFTASIEYRY